MGFPKVGSDAPAFALPNQEGREVSLAGFRGERNVVLYFYPKAMTPGCTVQACGLRDAKRELSALETAVLGLSPDPVERLARFAESKELEFDLLSDPDHAVADKYGAWGPKTFMGKKYQGILRTTFIIGKDGRVKHVMDKVKTKTHHDDVLEWIRGNL